MVRGMPRLLQGVMITSFIRYACITRDLSLIHCTRPWSPGIFEPPLEVNHQTIKSKTINNALWVALCYDVVILK